MDKYGTLDFKTLRSLKYYSNFQKLSTMGFKNCSKHLQTKLIGETGSTLPAGSAPAPKVFWRHPLSCWNRRWFA